MNTGIRKGLTAAFVTSVKAPGKYYDTNGLILRVMPSGSKQWVQRLRIQGRPRELGLGGFPLVTLAKAREFALENRRVARIDGGDPLAERRRRRSKAPSFEVLARQFYELHRPGWRNAKHTEQWLQTLEDYVFPSLGARAVDDITTQDVVSVLGPIWHTKPTTAKRVGQRIGAVMKAARAQKLRADNPAELVTEVLGKQTNRVTAQRSLPYAEVGAAIAAVRASGAAPVLKLAFEFLVLTAARSGEVRFATWNEVDHGAGTWTVPASRMKAHREHRVPLCGRAVEILDEARSLGVGRGELLFPSRGGRALTEGGFVQVLSRLGIDATAHGFRSSFRVWSQERTNIPREVCELALAHTLKDKAEAAYARSDLFDKRRVLMEAWAWYLAPESAVVVPLDERRGMSA